jgi:hypothetical protein
VEPFHLEVSVSNNLNGESSTPIAKWLAKITYLGLRQPDKLAVPINGDQAMADATYQAARTLIFLLPPAAETTAYAQDRGFTIIVFPADTAEWPAIFNAHPAIFGTPSSPA